MGGMAGVGVAPPPNHPPTSLAGGGSTRARHPGPSIARARCGGKRFPGCLSVPLPPKSPDFHPRQAPPNRPVPHRQVRRCSGKAHSRARTAAAAALARSLDRARSLLWRWSQRSVTPPVTRVTRAARHARARVRHHRASRASSPFPFPLHARMRALRRRSLARSIARVRCGCGDGGLAVGHAARHTHHALRASRARTCASSTGDTRVITVPFPPRARTPALQRKRRSLAPSIARARCGGKRHPGCLSVPLPPKSPDSPPLTIPSKPSRSSSPGTTMLGQSPLTRAHCGGGGARSLARSRARCVAVAVEVAGGYIARHARYARRASRACTRTSSPRIARVIAVFRPPRARPARARCSGGGARSLPRLRARGVAVVMAVAVGHAARDARNARRASRIRTRASSPRIARVITAPFPDVNHARARRSLARSPAAAYVATPHTARARVI